jgi:hypothetical protein
MNSHSPAVLLLTLIAATVSSPAQLREYPDASLKGIQGVRVVVKYAGPDERSYGLTQQQLQDAVELRLKADDVRVLTGEEWTGEPGQPYLCITIAGTRAGSEKTPVFFYSFAADLIQHVSLGRTPSVTTEGSTWNQDYALVVAQKDLREVTMKISDVAHEFAQSVRDANK